MEFGRMVCNHLSEVAECNLCALHSPTNPVETSCGHSFCWPCLYRFLKGRARPPCPVCATPLSNDIEVAPMFDPYGALVLRLPPAHEVEASCDDSMQLDCASFQSSEEDRELETLHIWPGDEVVFDEESKVINGNGIFVWWKT